MSVEYSTYVETYISHTNATVTAYVSSSNDGSLQDVSFFKRLDKPAPRVRHG